jgi:hypothetical protein
VQRLNHYATLGPIYLNRVNNNNNNNNNNKLSGMNGAKQDGMQHTEGRLGEALKKKWKTKQCRGSA